MDTFLLKQFSVTAHLLIKMSNYFIIKISITLISPDIFYLGAARVLICLMGLLKFTLLIKFSYGISN